MQRPVIDLDSRDVTLRGGEHEIVLVEADLPGAELAMRFAFLNSLSTFELREVVRSLAQARQQFKDDQCGPPDPTDPHQCF